MDGEDGVYTVEGKGEGVVVRREVWWTLVVVGEGESKKEVHMQG